MFERERESVFERVCVCLREKECVFERERVCVCVFERERESVCVFERERVCIAHKTVRLVQPNCSRQFFIQCHGSGNL